MSAPEPPLPQPHAVKQESRLLVLLLLTDLLLLWLAVNRGWPPAAWRILAAVLPRLPVLWREHHASLFLPLIFTLMEAAELPVCALASVSTVCWWFSTCPGLPLQRLLVRLLDRQRTPPAQGPIWQGQKKAELPVRAEPGPLSIQIASAN